MATLSLPTLAPLSQSKPSKLSPLIDPISRPSTSITNQTLPPISPRKSTKLPMSQKLQLHRQQRSPQHLPPVPERLLLRDIIYILQGINGQFVKFKTPLKSKQGQGPRRAFKRGAIVVDETPVNESLTLEDGIEFVLEGTGYSLSAPTRVLLHTLAELGWLYRKIDEKIDCEGVVLDDHNKKGKGVSTSIGMIEQSLHAALKSEMTEYYKLVAMLESELEEDDQSDVVEEGRMTLRRLLVWTDEVKLRMRMMGTLVEEAGGES